MEVILFKQNVHTFSYSTIRIFVHHIFVRYTYLFACDINEDVPDPYQCPWQITGYFALRR